MTSPARSFLVALLAVSVTLLSAAVPASVGAPQRDDLDHTRPINQNYLNDWAGFLTGLRDRWYSDEDGSSGARFTATTAADGTSSRRIALTWMRTAI